MTEVEVFQPVVVELVCYCVLCYGEGYEVLGFDYFAELKPSRPVIRELVQRLDKHLPGLLCAFLFIQHQTIQVKIQPIQPISMVQLLQLPLKVMYLRVLWRLIGPLCISHLLPFS